MKREDYFVQLVVAALLQFIMLGAATTFALRGGAYPLGSFLAADVACGLSLLGVIACLRRGYLAAKIGAAILCILPAIHVYHSIKRNEHALTHLWKSS